MDFKQAFDTFERDAVHAFERLRANPHRSEKKQKVRSLYLSLATVVTKMFWAHARLRKFQSNLMELVLVVP